MPDIGFDRALTLAREGSALLRTVVDGLTEDGVRAPSLLPGWSRAHLLTHLARNADALGNLLTWARTGTETPMYPDPATRLDDIETGARRPAAEVVADLGEADARLLQAMATLPEPAWAAPVRSALGRTIPASEVPWLRTREVWIHAVDLAGGGVDFDAFPADLVDALLTDAGRTVGGKEGCPPVVLRPTDRARTWALGPAGEPGGQPAGEVRGPAAGLAGWLLGRDTPGARAVAATTAVTPPAWL